MKRIKKGHIIAFLIGALLFGSIGVVVATNISSSTIDYVTANNQNVATVEDALDDLYTQIVGYPIACYNGVCGKLSYRYWNDDFSENEYAYNEIPTTVYATRELLEDNCFYRLFTSEITYDDYYGDEAFLYLNAYIRSILIDGNVVGHQACLWYDNKELCISPGYWAGTLNTASMQAETQTKIKLQRDIQETFGVTNTSCINYTDEAYCSINTNRIVVNRTGKVTIQAFDGHYCEVNSSKIAKCYIHIQEEI